MVLFFCPLEDLYLIENFSKFDKFILISFHIKDMPMKVLYVVLNCMFIIHRLPNKFKQ